MDLSVQQVARILKAISDPKRLQIVNMLCGGELGASTILASFDITQPTLSHDMHVLVASGLVKERRVGKSVLYSLNAAEVGSFMAALNGLVNPGKGKLIG